MIFCIRDDDISFFTNPERIESLYSGIWETVPVSFAVVPFVHGSARFVPDPHKGDKKYPVGMNKGLVKNLKSRVSKGKGSILLHGHSHEVCPAGHEFEIGRDLFEKVKEGKEYLESVFDTKIRSFVAPNHSFSRKGMRAVIDNSLNIVGAPPVLKRPALFGIPYFKNLIRLGIFRLGHGKGILYPHVVRYSGHKELYCYCIDPSCDPETIREGFRFCVKRDAIFCLTIHSNTIREEGISLLKELVSMSMEAGSKYSVVDDLF